MKLRILHLEDNTDDVDLVRRSLTRQGVDCSVQAVGTSADYLAALEQDTFDVILSDSGLPGYDGQSALNAAHAHYPGLPFIVVSSVVPPDPFAKTPVRGAAAHVAKSDIKQLGSAIQSALQGAPPQTVAEDPLSNLEQRLSERTDELRRRSAELEVANRELEAFSYSVAHDLRSPLIAIDGFREELLESGADRFNSEERDHLARIGGAVKRMHRIIEDLLRLSTITQAPLQREEADLAGIAREIAMHLRERDTKRRVTFSIPQSLPVRGDAGLLRVVLENLMANAWKFTARRAVARIEVDAVPAPEGEAVYFVRDNGAGFDPRYADKLFKPFNRLHTQADFPGTGIGLAIVQRVVHRHGGKIWARAETDSGATFYFTLPASLSA